MTEFHYAILIGDDIRDKSFAAVEYLAAQDYTFTWAGTVHANTKQGAAHLVAERHNRDDRPDGQVGPSFSVGDAIVLTTGEEEATYVSCRGQLCPVLRLTGDLVYDWPSAADAPEFVLGAFAPKHKVISDKVGPASEGGSKEQSAHGSVAVGRYEIDTDFWKVTIALPGADEVTRPLPKSLFPDPQALAEFLDQQTAFLPRYSVEEVKDKIVSEHMFGVVDRHSTQRFCAYFTNKAEATEYVGYLLSKAEAVTP